MRVFCVLITHFPWRCEALRHPEIQYRPAAVIHETGSQKLVLDCSPGLEDLQRDLPLQQVLSRHGEIALIQADFPHYQSLFNEILGALELKSPQVEGFDLGQAYLGLEGLQLIYPDDSLIIQAVREAVPEAFPIQIGIAEGKFPAYLAALRSPPGGYQVLNGGITAFLKDLPGDVLPVSIKSKGKLHSFGIHTLGQIAGLPPGPLQAQFGPEGQKIWELAGGHDDTPIYSRFFEEVIEDSLVLPSVTVSLEALTLALELLLTRAFIKVGPKGLGIRSLTIWTQGWNSEHWERGVKFKEPAMDVRSAISRIKPVLENFPQPGPVERVGLKITGLGHQSGHQRSLFSDVRARDHLLEDIKNLEQRLGGHQVFKIKEVEPWSRIPERRYALTPLSQ